MKRFIEGVERSQSTLFPERLEDFVAEDNPVRVVDVFVDNSISENWAFGVLIPLQQVDRPIIPRSS